MDIKRKQHLLPQSYLKHWISPESTFPPKTPMVWLISKDGTHKRPKPPAASAFWRDYFYDAVTPTGESDQSLENCFARLENELPQIIDERVTCKEPLDADESGLVNLFVACMFLRTEKFKDMIQSAADARARIERDWSAAYGLDIPDIERRCRNAFPAAICGSWQWLAEQLEHWSHFLLVAPSGKFFLTSDTPCMLQASVGIVGFANPALEIALPLTCTHALLLTRQISGYRYVDVNEDNVDRFNRRIVQTCSSDFISRTDKTEPFWFARP